MAVHTCNPRTWEVEDGCQEFSWYLIPKPAKATKQKANWTTRISKSTRCFTKCRAAASVRVKGNRFFYNPAFLFPGLLAVSLFLLKKRENMQIPVGIIIISGWG